MTAYLLDTNVVSLLLPSRAKATGLIAWLDKAEETAEFFLSVVTVHEVERGIVLHERKGATAKASGLRRRMTRQFQRCPGSSKPKQSLQATVPMR